MNGSQRFEFNDTERDTLLLRIGRGDAGAVHFIDDAELLLSNHLDAARSGQRGGLPRGSDDRLNLLDELCAELSESMADLPAIVQSLADLQWVSDVFRQRTHRDVVALARPLDEMRALIAELRQAAHQSQQGPMEPLTDRTIRAFAVAFRNRLNIKPHAHPDDLFMRATSEILNAAAAHVTELRELLAQFNLETVTRLLGTASVIELPVEEAAPPPARRNPFIKDEPKPDAGELRLVD